MPIHLRAEADDYASAVLCPGDPNRATYIADHVFDAGARLVNDERGLLGYTGTFDGQPISVQTTGMGCASAGIVFEELIALGAKRIIRVGTCGGLGPTVAMGDTIIATAATADDQTPLRYAQMESYAPSATFALTAEAHRQARALGQTVHVGPVVTSGVFYDPDPEAFSRWRRAGHLGVEMEAAMLYTVAAVHGVESLAICTVSDALGNHEHTERISDDALRRGVDGMVRVACRVAIG